MLKNNLRLLKNLDQKIIDRVKQKLTHENLEYIQRYSRKIERQARNLHLRQQHNLSRLLLLNYINQQNSDPKITQEIKKLNALNQEVITNYIQQRVCYRESKQIRNFVDWHLQDNNRKQKQNSWKGVKK